MSYVQGKKNFEETVNLHSQLLGRRGVAMAEEHMAPAGQAYFWYIDVVQQVPECGKKVAHQVARLCGDDSQVSTTYRGLADAVEQTDKTGPVSYVQRGLRILKEAGWLSIETVGQKRGAVTTFFLQPGEDTEYKKKWDDGFYDGSDWHVHHVA